jgi:hypothetical protein
LHAQTVSFSMQVAFAGQELPEPQPLVPACPQKDSEPASIPASGLSGG